MNSENRYYDEQGELMNRLYLETARCYANVFRDEPWSEAFKDKQGNFYDIGYWKQWKRLGFDRAYPIGETASYIKQETTKPNSVFVWQENPDCPRKIIGFAWGYSLDTVDGLVKDKWASASSSEQDQLKAVMQSAISSEPFWYFSEIGVLAKYRQKGLAMNLAQKLISQSPKDQNVLVRTNAISPLTIILNRLGFGQILGPKTMVSEQGLCPEWLNTVNMLDAVNPNRVMYILPKERRSR